MAYTKDQLRQFIEANRDNGLRRPEQIDVRAEILNSYMQAYSLPAGHPNKDRALRDASNAMMHAAPLPGDTGPFLFNDVNTRYRSWIQELAQEKAANSRTTLESWMKTNPTDPNVKKCQNFIDAMLNGDPQRINSASRELVSLVGSGAITNDQIVSLQAVSYEQLNAKKQANREWMDKNPDGQGVMLYREYIGAAMRACGSNPTDRTFNTYNIPVTDEMRAIERRIAESGITYSSNGKTLAEYFQTDRAALLARAAECREEKYNAVSSFMNSQETNNQPGRILYQNYIQAVETGNPDKIQASVRAINESSVVRYAGENYNAPLKHYFMLDRHSLDFVAHSNRQMKIEERTTWLDSNSSTPAGDILNQYVKARVRGDNTAAEALLTTDHAKSIKIDGQSLDQHFRDNKHLYEAVAVNYGARPLQTTTTQPTTTQPTTEQSQVHTVNLPTPTPPTLQQPTQPRTEQPQVRNEPQPAPQEEKGFFAKIMEWIANAIQSVISLFTGGNKETVAHGGAPVTPPRSTTVPPGNDLHLNSPNAPNNRLTQPLQGATR